MNPMITNLAIQELPAVIDFLKASFMRRHPQEPEPTSEQVIAAWQVAFRSSILKDEQWLAEHP